MKLVMARTVSSGGIPSSDELETFRVRASVGELLESRGIRGNKAERWIRRRLFSHFARVWQAIASRTGIDYFVAEHGLVNDFFQARCTDDVVDGLHQYLKMRGESRSWCRLIRPSPEKVLRTYWKLRGLREEEF